MSSGSGWPVAADHPRHDADRRSDAPADVSLLPALPDRPLSRVIVIPVANVLTFFPCAACMQYGYHSFDRDNGYGDCGAVIGLDD